MILLLDNYDSFTYNLYQYLKEISTQEIQVVRSDVHTAAELLEMNPEYIVISPGPGRPEKAGVSLELIRAAAGKIPILGVCLGMQAIAAAFGMEVVPAKNIIHGKTNPITHDGKGIFRSLSSPAVFTRYHSLAVKEESLRDDFEISARSPDGEIMGIRHARFVLEGVQFHPESIASEEGKKLLGNFLHYRREAFVPRDTLNKLLGHQSLGREEAQRWFEEVTAGNISPPLLAAFLTAFRMKKVSSQELAGAADVLQNSVKPIPLSGKLLDTCGTGGDGLGTFNISSLAALMAAACGARVAKHGNRGVSSPSGSSDFYQALGIPLNLEPGDSAALLEKTNFAFLFAPLYHPSMRHAAPVRKELRIKTLMNLLGPLVNPAFASHRLVGVYDGDLAQTMAEAAGLLGQKRGFFFSTGDGQDEISLMTPSRGFLLHSHGGIEPFSFEPKDFSLPACTLKDLSGGSAKENAEEAWEMAKGRGRPAVRDAVILNTAAALFVYEEAATLQEGIERVQEAWAVGALQQKMEEIIDTAKSLPSYTKNS